jgi:hypothetical protein
MTQPTGWHYHVCEGQFVYMLSGWVDLEFEDRQKLRIQSGESHTTFRAACGTTRRPHQETLSSWDPRSRGHGHRALRSARGLAQERVTPRQRSRTFTALPKTEGLAVTGFRYATATRLIMR